MPAPRIALYATEAHGTELPGTGPDDTETRPLPVLTGTLPLGFESEISRLASLAPIDNGKPHDDAADDDAADGGLASNGVADIRPPSHSRRRTQSAASAAASRPPGRQPGVARGLLMTPWFAAASGFVIAASLWIHSAHPQLTFPIATGSAPPCIPDSCSPPANPQSVPSLNINSGQHIAQHRSSAKPAGTGTRDQTGSPLSGLSFRYVERPAADGNFDLIVIVTGKHPIKDWHLAFVLAGDQVQSVFGADWQPAGSHGGTFSPLTGDRGQQNGGPGNYGGGPSDQGGDQYGFGNGGAFDQPGVIFTVTASGTPAAPTQCSFDGKSCTFHELPTLSQGAR